MPPATLLLVATHFLLKEFFFLLPRKIDKQKSPSNAACGHPSTDVTCVKISARVLSLEKVWCVPPPPPLVRGKRRFYPQFHKGFPPMFWFGRLFTMLLPRALSISPFKKL